MAQVADRSGQAVIVDGVQGFQEPGNGFAGPPRRIGDALPFRKSDNFRPVGCCLPFVGLLVQVRWVIVPSTAPMHEERERTTAFATSRCLW